MGLIDGFIVGYKVVGYSIGLVDGEVVGLAVGVRDGL